MKTAQLNSTARLSWPQRFCYGLGQGGGGIIYTLGTTFLLVYYTNVVHIDPAVSASIIAVSKLLDGLSDLLMGYIVDRTNSRFGKARPWLLRFVLPAMVCMFATFSVPAGLAGTAQIVYVFVSYNLLTTVCFTAVTVSYNSLNSLITTDQYERGINNVLGMTFNTVAMLALNMVMLKLCTFFGGGELYSGKGWSVTVGILCLIYGVCIMVTFLFCKEMEVGDKGARTEPEVKKAKLKTVRIIGMLVTNKYWVEYVLALVSVTICSGIVMGSALFYAQYVLDDVYSYPTLSTALYLSMFVGVIITSVFIKKIGKRNTAIIGCIILIVGTVAVGILPASVNNTLLTMILRGLGVGFPSAIGNAMLQDSLTYGKWKTGVHIVGMGNAASSFVQKLSSGLSVAVIGWVLSLGGFDSNQAVQSAGAQGAITALFVWIPLIFVVAALLCFIAYRLDKEYAGYIADMNEGKYGPKAIVVPDETDGAEAKLSDQ
ncbi:MAG: MFS transporter [Clostridiales Family XIII bacterium]|jgi:GPH family glycoside/pentoside/hexuronide:cation symporter|nr:MFS transporter [Clostridiales Family XIII bacterium]